MFNEHEDTFNLSIEREGEIAPKKFVPFVYSS